VIFVPPPHTLDCFYFKLHGVYAIYMYVYYAAFGVIDDTDHDAAAAAADDDDDDDDDGRYPRWYITFLARDAQAKLALIVAQCMSIHLSICVSVRDSLSHAYVRSTARREPRRLPACLYGSVRPSVSASVHHEKFASTISRNPVQEISPDFAE